MPWHVSRNGKTKGPFETADVIAGIAKGQVAPDDLVCQDGGDKWIKVKEVADFASNAPVTAPAATPAVTAKISPKPWLAVVSLALGCIAVGLVIWKLFEAVTYDAAIVRALQESNDHQRAILAELKPLTKKAVWATEKQVMNTCSTNRDTVTCTFTNKEEFPVTTCVRGLLYQKEATGVRLNALPMCTGRLMPLETKVVTSAWVAGFADDICYRENAYGKNLDWSKCVFTTESFDMSDVIK